MNPRHCSRTGVCARVHDDVGPCSLGYSVTLQIAAGIASAGFEAASAKLRKNASHDGPHADAFATSGQAGELEPLVGGTSPLYDGTLRPVVFA
jgi:hypothetical protein